METEESFNTQLLGLPMPLERGKNQTLSPRTKGEEMANDEQSVKWPSATRTRLTQL